MNSIKAKEKNGKIAVIKRLLSRIGRYRAYLLISLILALVSVAASLYLPFLVGEAIDCIVGAGEVDFARMTGILITAAVVIVFTALVNWIMNTVNNAISYGVVRDLRVEAFAHIQTLPLSHIDSHGAGETVSRIISDVEQIADGLLIGFTQVFTGVITILGTLVFMLRINVATALAVVILTPLSFFVSSFIARKTYRFFHDRQATIGEQTAYVEEMISGQKTVIAFTREDESCDCFDEINDRLSAASLKATFFSSLTNPTTRFVNSLVYAAAAFVGAISAVGGGMTVGGLSCVLSYAGQYTKPFNEISGVITELTNAVACAERVLSLIDAPSEVPDAEFAADLHDRVGHVQLSDVYFSYSSDRPLIEDLDLTVEPGQRVAIVGPTGCGKTTLINLLMRFYDVSNGSIRVDGIDIREMPRAGLRRGYGMVLQQTWLKSGTVRENLCMGKPDATEDEMIAAAKASHAHGFIKRLPRGYDTVIGEDGGNFSEGERQLLCIARVMLCLPPMLILDEATSSIDTRTEMKIQETFARMMKGRTTFIVAHRLSTIREADVILVMRDGHVVEQGRHDELLEKGGFYSTLYNSQFER